MLKKNPVATCASQELTKRLEVSGVADCLARSRPVQSCALTGVSANVPEAKGVADCLLQRKPLEVCVAEEASKNLPPEARSVANCVTATRSFEQCASQEVRKVLPDELQAVFDCVQGTKKSAADCAAEDALRKLPPGVQATAQCISDRIDLGRCTGQAASGTDQKQVLDLIDKLKADGRSELGATDNGAIRNIIMIAEGIKNDDWDMVALGGGTVVMQAAGKIILKILLPPLVPLGPVGVDQIIDVIIQSKADVIGRVIKGAKAGDAGAVGEAIAEAYLSLNFVVPCALPIIPEAIRVAVCGPIGKVIREIAGVAGDIVDVAQDIIEDPLHAPGILLGAASDTFANTIGGKDNDCIKPPQYYNTNYVACLPSAAILQINGGGIDNLTASLNNTCRKYYDRCFTSSHFNGLCNPQREQFVRDVGKLTLGIQQAAAVYMETFPDFLKSKVKPSRFGCFGSDQLLDSGLTEFVNRCAQALDKQLPLSRLQCMGGQQATLSPVNANSRACQQAFDQINARAMVDRICPERPSATAPVTPPSVLNRPPSAGPPMLDANAPARPGGSPLLNRPATEWSEGASTTFRPGTPAAAVAAAAAAAAAAVAAADGRGQGGGISTSRPGGGQGGGQGGAQGGGFNTTRPGGSAAPSAGSTPCPPGQFLFKGECRGGVVGPQQCPDGQLTSRGIPCPPSPAQGKIDAAQAGQGGGINKSAPICPTGQFLFNGECRTGGVLAGPKTCASGQKIAVGQLCPEEIAANKKTETVCAGNRRPLPNGLCPESAASTSAPPVICPDGRPIPPGRKECVFGGGINKSAPIGASAATCPPGQISVNGVCKTGGIVSPVKTKVCPDKSIVLATATCPIAVGPTPTKACPDGSRVPATANCPNQTKTCPGGSRVPVTAECPKPPTTTPPVPKKIPPPVKASQVTCRSVRTCVVFAKPRPGAPASIGGNACLRYEMKRVCGGSGNAPAPR